MHAENLDAPTQDSTISNSLVTSSQLGGQTGHDSTTAQNSGSGSVIQNVYRGFLHFHLSWDSKDKLGVNASVNKSDLLSENVKCRTQALPRENQQSLPSPSASTKPESEAEPEHFDAKVRSLILALPRENQQSLPSPSASAKPESEAEPEHFDAKVRSLILALPRENQQSLPSPSASAKPESEAEPEHFDAKVRSLVQALPAGNPQLA